MDLLVGSFQGPGNIMGIQCSYPRIFLRFHNKMFVYPEGALADGGLGSPIRVIKDHKGPSVISPSMCLFWPYRQPTAFSLGSVGL